MHLLCRKLRRSSLVRRTRVSQACGSPNTRASFSSLPSCQLNPNLHHTSTANLPSTTKEGHNARTTTEYTNTSPPQKSQYGVSRNPLSRLIPCRRSDAGRMVVYPIVLGEPSQGQYVSPACACCAFLSATFTESSLTITNLYSRI